MKTLKDRNEKSWENYAYELSSEGRSLTYVISKVTGIPACRVKEIWLAVVSHGTEI
jgi:hypothetical protein